MSFAASQYDCDLAPGRGAIPPDTVIVLRQSPDMVYTVWTGLTWALFRLDMNKGTSGHVGDYPSFIEAKRAAEGRSPC
jgi:hypothetical protein